MQSQVQKHKRSRKGDLPAAADDAVRDEALWLVRSVYVTMRRQLTQQRRATGLPAAQLWALAEIADGGMLRIGDLARRMRMHPSTASNLCAKLRAAGLATATQASDDRRALCLRTTPAGMATLRRAPRPQRGVLREALTRLSSADCRRLSAALAPLERELAAVAAESQAGERPRVTAAP